MVQIWDKSLLLTRVIPALEELLLQKRVEVHVPTGPIGFGMAMDFLSILRPLIKHYRVELALAGLRRPACEGAPQAEFYIKFVSTDRMIEKETPALPRVTLSCGRDSIIAKLTPLTNSDRAYVMGARWGMLTYLRDHLPAAAPNHRLELWRGGKAISTNLRFYQPAGLATQPNIPISQTLYKTMQHGVG